MQPEEQHSIQSLGGQARAEKLSADELSEQASKAATARWANRPMKAIHKGNFKKEFGFDVDCYVLNDANKTAVISQRGMGVALGMHARGDAFPRFMSTAIMADAAGPELRDKLAQPVKFHWGTGGPEGPPSIVHGYDVTLLIDVCRAILAVEEKLGPRQIERIKQARAIIAASAKSGIKGLVYALAGYNPSAEEVIQAFKHYVQEEARKYEKEFPAELYAEWYRLYRIQPLPRGRPWHFKHLTVNHVYAPLARSNGKLYKLLQDAKASGGVKNDKLFQFLNEVGTRALRFHLGRLYEIASSSPSKEAYDEAVKERFYKVKQLTLDLVP